MILPMAEKRVPIQTMYSEGSKDMYEVVFAPPAERYLKKLKNTRRNNSINSKLI